MREPDFDLDGWCLDDGEEYHAEAPGTFWIPAIEDRERLVPGELVKLIFRIAVDDAAEPVAVERMSVLVRERVGGIYFGILDNDPYAIAENDRLWRGVEIRSSSVTLSITTRATMPAGRWRRRHPGGIGGEGGARRGSGKLFGARRPGVERTLACTQLKFFVCSDVLRVTMIGTLSKP